MPSLRMREAKLLRPRQHVRQVGVVIGDVVDVEEDGAGDAALGVERFGVARIVRHEPGGVDDADVGRVEPLGQPGAGDDGIAGLSWADAKPGGARFNAWSGAE